MADQPNPPDPDPYDESPYEPPDAFPPYGSEPAPRPESPAYGQPAPLPGAYPPPGFPAAPGYPVFAPFGIDPMTGVPYSDKSKVAAGLLQLLPSFVGICGVGRLYAGHTAIGLVQLLGVMFGWLTVCILIGIPIVGGLWLWTVIDGIVILTSNSRDGSGRVMR